MGQLAPLESFEQRQQYELEKATGERRPNGAQLLKRLSPKHRQVIDLHLTGVPNAEIAQRMGMRQAWVSTILHDPLAEEFIKKRYAMLDREFKALGPKVVDTLRRALDKFEEDPMLAMNAADKYLRAHGYFDKGKATTALTAEDIVSEMLRQTAEGGTTSMTISVQRRGDEPEGDFSPKGIAAMLEHDPEGDFA